MSNKIVVKVKSGGLTIFAVLQVLFLGLKLAEVGLVASWSWWWVFVPLWGPLALVAVLGVLILCGVGTFLALGVLVHALRRRRIRKRREADEARRDAARKLRMTRPHKK